MLLVKPVVSVDHQDPGEIDLGAGYQSLGRFGLRLSRLAAHLQQKPPKLTGLALLCRQQTTDWLFSSLEAAKRRELTHLTAQ